MQCSASKGEREKLGKIILRSFYVCNECKSVLPFSKNPKKIQVDFQLLSNNIMLRWAHSGPTLAMSINRKYNDSLFGAQITSLEV